MVVVGGAVMHIGGQPYGIGNLVLAQKTQQVGHLQLAALGRAAVVVRDRFPAADARADFAVGYAQTDGHVGGDDLPLGL